MENDNEMPKEDEKVLLFEGRYRGADLILAAAAVQVTPQGEHKIEPGWFTLIFIGSKEIRKLGKRLCELKDKEEFMLYVQNPEMPEGSV